MPKKISELPKTTTLSNDDVFVVNREGATNIITTNNLRNNITSNISISASQLLTSNANNGDVLTFDGSKWIPKAPVQTSGIPNFGNDIIVGFFLPPGTNKTWIVPVGLSNIEIISQGSGGDGAFGESISTYTFLDGSTLLIPKKTIPNPNFNPNFNIIYGIRNGGRGAEPTRGSSGGGGGSGGWVRKTLSVTAGQIFTYTCGIAKGACTISSGSWSMTAGAGGNASTLFSTNFSSTPTGGSGGVISGDYTQGFNGEAGGSGTNSGFYSEPGWGGRGRDLKGVLDGPGSVFGGYIYIKIN